MEWNEMKWTDLKLIIYVWDGRHTPIKQKIISIYIYKPSMYVCTYECMNVPEFH